MYTIEELEKIGFAYIGKDVKIFKNSILVNTKNIYLGDGCQIDDFCHIIASQSIKIGKRVHIATQTTITGGGEFEIGDYSGIAAGCRIITGSDDFLGNAMIGPCVPIEYRKVNRSFVKIEKHVILGTNNIVLPSVTIPEGLASTVSTVFYKNPPEGWGIYKGNPAEKVARRKKDKILKMEEELINKYGY
ncbi:MAG: acyltransferase [Treponemataceae bacterium]